MTSNDASDRARGGSNEGLLDLITDLKEGREANAVPEFIRLLSTDAIPRDREMIPWLVRELGQPLLSRLINAFIQFPCSYCREGRVVCESCWGRGFMPDLDPCSRCVGMGLDRCGFCNGSGRVTIDYVPGGLQLPVMRGRALVAFKRIRNLLHLPLTGMGKTTLSQVIASLHARVRQIDREMGVFESLFIAISQPGFGAEPGASDLAQIMTTCVSLSAEAETRICDGLRIIAEAYRMALQASGDHVEREKLERAVRFYQELVDPQRTLAGTGLEHPFLHRAVKMRPAGSGSANLDLNSLEPGF